MRILREVEAGLLAGRNNGRATIRRTGVGLHHDCARIKEREGKKGKDDDDDDEISYCVPAGTWPRVPTADGTGLGPKLTSLFYCENSTAPDPWKK